MSRDPGRGAAVWAWDDSNGFREEWSSTIPQLRRADVFFSAQAFDSHVKSIHQPLLVGLGSQVLSAIFPHPSLIRYKVTTYSYLWL